jgi:hypothetical protein
MTTPARAEAGIVSSRRGCESKEKSVKTVHITAINKWHDNYSCNHITSLGLTPADFVYPPTNYDPEPWVTTTISASKRSGYRGIIMIIATKV